MTYEHFRQLDLQKEVSSIPKVLFTTHGFIHNPLNLQGVPKIINAFENHLNSHGGKKVLYIENANLSYQSVDIYNKFINRHGFRGTLLGAIISSETGIFPPNEIIEARASLIEEYAQGDVQQILRKNLLQLDQIQDYFLYKEFDRLHDIHQFTTDFEAHDNVVLQKTEIIDRQSTIFSENAMQSWKRGRFDHAINIYENFSLLTEQETKLRENDMANQSQNIIKSLYSEEAGGSLFNLVGEAHLPLNALVYNRLREFTEVQYSQNAGMGDELPVGKMYRYLRNGEKVPQKTYMHNIMINIVLPALINRSLRFSTVSDLSENYETIFRKVNGIASDISLAKGRQLCEDRASLLDYFLSQW